MILPVKILLFVIALVLGAFSGIALRKLANWYILPEGANHGRSSIIPKEE